MIVLEYGIRQHWQEPGSRPGALVPLRPSPVPGRIRIP